MLILKSLNQLIPMVDNVSLILPCRNEVQFIEGTMQDIVNQDYPKENLEVWFVDGMSEDGTRDTINTYCKQYPYIKLLDNPTKKISFALNSGIRTSQGEYIMRMDVHASYPTNYVSGLIKAHQILDADNVGGIWLTRPSIDTVEARCIALALSSSFGIGGADYRIQNSTIKESDTVPFGCYKREIFEQIGLFDESLNRNQDDEFNGRLIKNGGKIFLIPEIEIIYYSRSTLSKLWTMFFEYGFEKPLVNKKLGRPYTLRQLVPPLFVLSLIGSFFLGVLNLSYMVILIGIIGSYILIVLLVSFYISLGNSNKVVFVLPLTFTIIHLSYGISYLKGCIEYLILGRDSGVNESIYSR